MPTFLYKESLKVPSKEEKAAYDAFVRDAFTSMPKGRLIKVGENLVLVMHGCPLPPHSLFMGGVLVGDVRRGILHPSHQLFSALGKFFKLKVELGTDGEGVEKYLLGEEIPVSESGAGFCVATVMGAPLGGGKISDGRMKNHYPKGLRNKNNQNI